MSLGGERKRIRKPPPHCPRLFFHLAHVGSTSLETSQLQCPLLDRQAREKLPCPQSPRTCASNSCTNLGRLSVAPYLEAPEPWTVSGLGALDRCCRRERSLAAGESELQLKAAWPPAGLSLALQDAIETQGELLANGFSKQKNTF